MSVTTTRPKPARVREIPIASRPYFENEAELAKLNALLKEQEERLQRARDEVLGMVEDEPSLRPIAKQRWLEDITTLYDILIRISNTRTRDRESIQRSLDRIQARLDAAVADFKRKHKNAAWIETLRAKVQTSMDQVSFFHGIRPSDAASQNIAQAGGQARELLAKTKPYESRVLSSILKDEIPKWKAQADAAHKGVQTLIQQQRAGDKAFKLENFFPPLDVPENAKFSNASTGTKWRGLKAASASFTDPVVQQKLGVFQQQLQQVLQQPSLTTKINGLKQVLLGLSPQGSLGELSDKLKVHAVSNEPAKRFVAYVEAYKKQAQELLDICEKFDQYLTAAEAASQKIKSELDTKLEAIYSKLEKGSITLLQFEKEVKSVYEAAEKEAKTAIDQLAASHKLPNTPVELVKDLQARIDTVQAKLTETWSADAQSRATKEAVKKAELELSYRMALTRWYIRQNGLPADAQLTAEQEKEIREMPGDALLPKSGSVVVDGITFRRAEKFNEQTREWEVDPSKFVIQLPKNNELLTPAQEQALEDFLRALSAKNAKDGKPGSITIDHVGHPANYERIMAAARRLGIEVINNDLAFERRHPNIIQAVKANQELRTREREEVKEASAYVSMLLDPTAEIDLVTGRVTIVRESEKFAYEKPSFIPMALVRLVSESGSESKEAQAFEALLQAQYSNREARSQHALTELTSVTGGVSARQAIERYRQLRGVIENERRLLQALYRQHEVENEKPMERRSDKTLASLQEQIDNAQARLHEAAQQLGLMGLMAEIQRVERQLNNAPSDDTERKRLEEERVGLVGHLQTVDPELAQALNERDQAVKDAKGAAAEKKATEALAEFLATHAMPLREAVLSDLKAVIDKLTATDLPPPVREALEAERDGLYVQLGQMDSAIYELNKKIAEKQGEIDNVTELTAIPLQPQLRKLIADRDAALPASVPADTAANNDHYHPHRQLVAAIQAKCAQVTSVDLKNLARQLTPDEFAALYMMQAKALADAQIAMRLLAPVDQKLVAGMCNDAAAHLESTYELYRRYRPEILGESRVSFAKFIDGIRHEKQAPLLVHAFEERCIQVVEGFILNHIHISGVKFNEDFQKLLVDLQARYKTAQEELGKLSALSPAQRQQGQEKLTTAFAQRIKVLLQALQAKLPAEGVTQDGCFSPEIVVLLDTVGIHSSSIDNTLEGKSGPSELLKILQGRANLAVLPYFARTALAAKLNEISAGSVALHDRLVPYLDAIKSLFDKHEKSVILEAKKLGVDEKKVKEVLLRQFSAEFKRHIDEQFDSVQNDWTNLLPATQLMFTQGGLTQTTRPVIAPNNSMGTFGLFVLRATAATPAAPMPSLLQAFAIMPVATAATAATTAPAAALATDDSDDDGFVDPPSVVGNPITMDQLIKNLRSIVADLGLWKRDRENEIDIAHPANHELALQMKAALYAEIAAKLKIHLQNAKDFFNYSDPDVTDALAAVGLTSSATAPIPAIDEADPLTSFNTQIVGEIIAARQDKLDAVVAAAVGTVSDLVRFSADLGSGSAVSIADATPEYLPHLLARYYESIEAIYEEAQGRIAQLAENTDPAHATALERLRTQLGVAVTTQIQALITTFAPTAATTTAPASAAVAAASATAAAPSTPERQWLEALAHRVFAVHAYDLASGQTPQEYFQARLDEMGRLQALADGITQTLQAALDAAQTAFNDATTGTSKPSPTYESAIKTYQDAVAQALGVAHDQAETTFSTDASQCVAPLQALFQQVANASVNTLFPSIANTEGLEDLVGKTEQATQSEMAAKAQALFTEALSDLRDAMDTATQEVSTVGVMTGPASPKLAYAALEGYQAAMTEACESLIVVINAADFPQDRKQALIAKLNESYETSLREGLTLFGNSNYDTTVQGGAADDVLARLTATLVHYRDLVASATASSPPRSGVLASFGHAVSAVASALSRRGGGSGSTPPPPTTTPRR